MKKLTVMMLALLFLGAALVAASGSKEGEAGKLKEVEVTFWAFPLGSTDDESMAFYDSAVEVLAKDQPHIKVTIELFPWGGRREKMLTSLAAGTNPDAAYLNDDMKPLFEGNLLDLYEYITEEELKDFNPSTIEAATYRGALAYLPVLSNASAMFYNMKLMEKAGYSREYANSFHTWEDFIAACEKVRATGEWPYLGYLVEAATNHFSPWLYQAGGEWFNKDVTKSTIGSPQGIEAARMQVLLWEKYINPAFKDAPNKTISEAFEQDKAAMLLGQNHWIKNWLQHNPDLDLVFGYPLENKKKATSGTVAGYGVFSATKHPRETADWVKALTSYPAMLDFCTKTAFVPPRISVLEKMAAESTDAVFKRAAEDQQWFRVGVPASPVGPGHVEAWRVALQKMVLTNVPAEQAMAEFDGKATALLDDYYRKRAKQ